MMKKHLFFPLIALLFVSGVSFAQVTEEETVPIEVEEKPVAGYKGGFFLQSPDENFKFTIKGGAEPSFYYEKSTGQKGAFNFRMRRVSLSFKGVVQKKLTISSMLLHVPNPKFTTARFAGVTAAYELSPAFVVTAGMVGLPLDLGGLLLIEPPLTATRTDQIPLLTPTRFSFGSPDGLGVQFSGDAGRVHYATGIINANEDSYTLDASNRNVSFGGNVSVDILESALGTSSDFEYSTNPKLSANVGFNYQGKRVDSLKNNEGKETLSGATINRILTATSGLVFRSRGFALTLEGYVKNMKLANRGLAPVVTVPKLTLTDLGYYGTIGYFIIPKKIELAALWAQIRREGPDNDSYQLGGGLNYYIHGSNSKLQVNFTRSTFYQDIIGTRNKNVNNFTVALSSKF